jgi:hypothetical protein
MKERIQRVQLGAEHVDGHLPDSSSESVLLSRPSLVSWSLFDC